MNNSAVTNDVLAQEFVQFSLDCGVLKFGEFKTACRLTFSMPVYLMMALSWVSWPAFTPSALSTVALSST